MDYSLVILKIENREGTAGKVQEILTRNGCLIKVRLGLHEQAPNACSPLGLVVLHVNGTAGEIAAFVKELDAVPGTVVRLVEV